MKKSLRGGYCIKFIFSKLSKSYLSINGETTNMGLPTSFIRLAGCNLNCWNGCDTEYAVSSNAGTEMPVTGIIDHLKLLGCPRICLTGGEPLLNTTESMILLQSLVDEGFQDVSVETNGSIDLKPFKEQLGSQIRFIMDLKPPSSGMKEKNLFSNLALMSEDDEVKIVIANEADFKWALTQIKSLNPMTKILFSPLFGKLEPEHLVKWILEAKLWNSRIQLQLHKYIWSPETKGV